MSEAPYYTTSKAEIVEIVKRMGEACLQGEAHAAAGTMPPGFSRGYEDPELRAAYLIGMERMREQKS